MKKYLAFSVLVLTLSSCASHPDVRPGLDGIHTITTHGENIKDTESKAYKQVYSYCKEQKKTVEFLSDDSFKATSTEVSLETKEGLFKKEEAAATDIKFKCIDL